jgi:uncharacterized membrane protein
MAAVLIAGESWSTVSVHTKGFDSFSTAAYGEGVAWFRAALEDHGHDVTFMPNHMAGEHFPSLQQELAEFDIVVLSDIGANTLLLHPDTFGQAQSRPNRLVTLRDWVSGGGALAMVGGYLSFQGIEGKANYRATPIADVLPVQMEAGDDRQEAPERANVEVTSVAHEITADLPRSWPELLGFQRLVAKPDATTLATINGWPLLVVGAYGQGRSLAFASDMGPHWAPLAFTEWPGYATLWDRCMSWLAGEGSD